MKSSLRNNIFIVLFTLLCVIIFKKGYKYIDRPFARYTKLLKETYTWELKKQQSEPEEAVFEEQGIDDIALVTMIKDEEDIIYENLVWHFCIGFRKFIIVDNNSTDNTRMLVNKFRNEVKDKAQVIIIDDPIKEYIQSPVTTGAMKFANLVWPKVNWVFPVDADEFWYPEAKLGNIMHSIPKDKNAVQVLQHNYAPTEKADNFDGSVPFYKSITCRTKFNSEQPYSTLIGKIAIKPDQMTLIAQGNHNISKPKDRSDNYIGYVSANKIGIKMLHFQRRSVAQVQKKYTNGAAANILGQEKGVIGKEEGRHWSSFASEIEDKGAYQAAVDRFNGCVVDRDSCVNAPLPMDKAFDLYQKIINN